MPERIFFISPLLEDEDEKKPYYDKRGNATAPSYQEQPAAQPQPEENPIIENRIIIIYEAPKPKVITEQIQEPEAILNILTPEEIPGAELYPQPEEYTARIPKPYEQLMKQTYSKEPSYRQIMTQIYEEQPAYKRLMTQMYGEKSSTEENQLATIRSELQGIAQAA